MVATPLFSAIKYYSINGTLTVIIITIAQILFSFSLSALLFALIYKVLPEIKIHWQDVILPAIVTSMAFTVTNYVLGFYVQTFTVTTIIGAAGSLMIILLWIFILNLIILFGAEVSKVYASTFGPHPHEHSPLAIEKILQEKMMKSLLKLNKGKKEKTTKPEEQNAA